MFTLKKTIKAGVCAANRCTDMTPNKLCEKHDRAWREAGCPDLSAPPPPKPVASGDPVPEERVALLVEQRPTLTQLLAAANVTPLDTDEQIAEAQTHQNTAHRLAKELAAERDSVKDPLKAAIKKIDSWFKPNIDTLEAIKNTFARRIGQVYADRERARSEALRVIQANAGAAPAEAFTAAHAITTAPEESGGLIETVTVEVTDFTILPDEYKILTINMPKLKAAADAGAREIPGVRITVTQKTRVGRAA
jgi:hypothetical protein